MTPLVGTWLAAIAALAALVSWRRSTDVLRQDAVILPAIFLYFLIGTLDVNVVPTEWSPRFYVNPEVWVIVGLGAIAYLIGSKVGRRPRAGTWQRDPGPSPQGSRRAGKILTIIGWVALVLLLLTSRAPLITGADREAASGYLTAPSLLLVPGVLLLLAARAGRWQRREWLTLVTAAAALLLTNYRSYTLILGLAAGTLYFLDASSARQRRRVVLFGLPLAIICGVMFGYIRLARLEGDRSAQLVEWLMGSSEPTIWRVALAYGFFGFFREGPAMLGFLVDQHPALSPFTHGRALLGSLTSPLPGAQLDARAILSIEVYGSEQTSLVSSIFGPWYLDFGIVGVIVGMFVLGLILGWLEQRAFLGRDPVSRAAYAFGTVVMLLAVHSGLSDFTYMVAIPAAFVWASRTASVPAPEEKSDTER
jgi:uncharacterized membrane protein